MSPDDILSKNRRDIFLLVLSILLVIWFLWIYINGDNIFKKSTVNFEVEKNDTDRELRDLLDGLIVDIDGREYSEDTDIVDEITEDISPSDNLETPDRINHLIIK